MPSYKIKARNVSDLTADIAKKTENERKRQEERKRGPRFANRVTDVPILVRFLANPDNGGWVEFQQYWDAQINRPVIALESNEDEYKERGVYASTKYYAPVLDVKEARVMVMELPYTLAKEVNRLRDRWGGDLLDFDIELSKTGTGTDTEYHADYSGGGKLSNIDEYDVPDMWAILDRRVRDQLGLDDADDSDDHESDVEPAVEKVAAPRKFAIKKG